MSHSEAATRISDEFRMTFATFLERPAVRRLVQGEATLIEYGSFLRQVFHQTRDNPQLQAHATAYFRGDQRTCIRKFLGHAVSEIGHEYLALRDLENLGVPASVLVDRIPHETPLPETQAFTAYAHYQMQFVDPVAYLGVVYFLEFMPTTIGEGAALALDRMGVPADSRSFIDDHVAIDVAHNRLMESYLEFLAPTEDKQNLIASAVKAAARLYGNMIEAAFEAADQPGLTDTFPLEMRPKLQAC